MKVFLSFVILVIFSSQISAFIPFDYVDMDANLERGDNGKPQKSTDFLGEIEKSLANAKQNFFTILDNFSQNLLDLFSFNTNQKPSKTMTTPKPIEESTLTVLPTLSSTTMQSPVPSPPSFSTTDSPITTSTVETTTKI
ncbi:uncharacterized protein LOC109613468 [Musca domestica]|uniref:Uncharacterized protein LOC109613468 n=1 Tax=Musca domestica TaxID=7370 RepID=A0A9J7IF54_MUSDO|nr:uncharacterized protein LOC109613468 [Musca domestica]